ncbi:MAG: OB-fold domain-containing protein [Dehalococcoidia bacterium]|nr:OB-fold domain-containing protein [Dehalococcoidia bacterium]
MTEPLPNANKADLLPEPTERDAPFWEGLRASELRLQRCSACASFQYPAESFCYDCGATSLQWERVSGGGEVYSFITVHQRYHPAFGDNTPYNVSIIALDEGPRLVSNVIGTPSNQVTVGMRVQASPQALTDERSWLYFRPA